MIVLFLLQAANSFAYPPAAYDYNFQMQTSTFEIKLTGNGYISVAIDGDYFNDPVKKFSVSNMAPGNHYVEIFSEKMVHSGYYSNTQMTKIFSGKVYIEPASLVKGVVDNFGRFYIRDVDPLVAYTNNYQPYQPYQPYDPHACQPAPVYNMPVAMNEYSYQQLLDVVNNQWFENTKMSVIQQALQSNWFTSAQIAGLMHSFSFEDSKLELAKAAYGHVVDPQAYYVVNNEFWFSSSVEDLSSYIRSYH